MSKAYYTQEEVSKIKQARLLKDRGVTHYAGCAALGDLDHMNLIQLEEMVLHHAQQIKDIAKHLLELKQLVTPMMESRCVEAIEAKLKDKNTCSLKT